MYQSNTLENWIGFFKWVCGRWTGIRIAMLNPWLSKALNTKPRMSSPTEAIVDAICSFIVVHFGEIVSQQLCRAPARSPQLQPIPSQVFLSSSFFLWQGEACARHAHAAACTNYSQYAHFEILQLELLRPSSRFVPVLCSLLTFKESNGIHVPNL